MGEVEKLLPDMLQAAELLQKQYPQSCFIIPAASQPIRDFTESRIRQIPEINARVFDSNAKTIMAAADVVVLASGTATLEVMLINRPMVVCYRFSGTTYRMFKWLKLLITPYIALPNILAGEELVPELLQDNVSPENIARQVQNWLQEPQRCAQLKSRFIEIHEQLRTDAAATAAIAVLNHIALNQDRLHG
jgi:lipid-A-disaccharide synthase